MDVLETLIITTALAGVGGTGLDGLIGAMLYVVFGEILPQSILMYHSKLPAFSAITGILVGILIIFLILQKRGSMDPRFFCFVRKSRKYRLLPDRIRP